MSEPRLDGPLTVHTKVELIRQRLEADIVEGRREPGSRIVLDEVARTLGVSKIPVREALSSLESQGLVIQAPHAGARVAPLSLREFRAVYLLREEIEALVAREAARTVDDATIERLREVNDRMRRHLRSGDEAAMADLNTEFHLVIAEATTYDALVAAVSSSLRTVRRYRSVVARLAANWGAAVAEHDEVVTALATRDPARAEAAVRGHVGSQRKKELGVAAADD